jgi:DNA-binding transcriptional LysR family regulator
VTLRQLRSFVALAEELHFRRAAARLHLTQPALSHQLRQLETTVGVRLVERDRRNVALTAAGTAFQEEAKRALADVARAIEVAQRTAVAGRALHVCCMSSARRLLAPGILRRLDPAVDVVWIERTEEELAPELLAGRYDVVLSRFPPRADGLETTLLLQERPGVRVCRGDPLAALPEIPLRALADRRVRTPRAEIVPQFVAAIRRDLRAAGVERDLDPTLSWETWSSGAMIREVAAGEYVAIGGFAFGDVEAQGTDVVVVVPLELAATPIPLTMTKRVGDARAHVLAFAEAVCGVVAANDLPGDPRRWRADA